MSQPKNTPKPSHPDEGTDGWCTPQWLAAALGTFDLDPCSNVRSSIVARETCSLDGTSIDCVGRDGLACDWFGLGADSVFCNPPYSNVGPWARKLVEFPGAWVALVKIDPTTRWWATFMSVFPTVAPFRKRIKFESGQASDTTANFPSALIYSAWRPPAALAPHLWLPTYTQ